MENELEMYLNHLKKVAELENKVSTIFENLHYVIKTIKKSSTTDIDNKEFNKYLSKAIGQKTNIEDYADIDIKKIFLNNTKKVMFGLISVNYKKVEDEISDTLEDETDRRIKALNKSFKETGIKVPSYVADIVSDIRRGKDQTLFNEFESKVELCNSFSDLIGVCDAIKLRMFLNELSERVDDLSNSLSDIENRLASVEYKID